MQMTNAASVRRTHPENHPYLILNLLLTTLTMACSQKHVASRAAAGASSPAADSAFVSDEGPNVLPLTVDGTICGPGGHGYNMPCTEVTVCIPGTSTCQTIGNILVDTDSVGLRLFDSVINFQPEAIQENNGSLAECYVYVDGHYDWGSVAYVDLQLGQENPVRAAIQMINADFMTAPSVCANPKSLPDTDAESAGFKGILGVQPALLDCGDLCTNTSQNYQYFSCNSESCRPTATDVQLAQPVSLLGSDNNGVILELPSVPSGGSRAISGQLLLGIGTRPNNSASGATALPATAGGHISGVLTAYGPQQLDIVMDSGNPAYNFPSLGEAPPCFMSSQAPGGFCPTQPLNLALTLRDTNGDSPVSVAIQVENASALLTTANTAFATISAPLAAANQGDTMTLGLPFFFGRAVYFGLDGAASTLGKGPIVGFKEL